MHLTEPGNQYDPRTAVTFLLAGLGIGALAALLFAPRSLVEPRMTSRRADAGGSEKSRKMARAV